MSDRVAVPAWLIVGRVALLATAVLALAAVLTVWLRPVVPAPLPKAPVAGDLPTADLDGLLADHWRQVQVTPTAPAEATVLARRLSLALHGTIPSLQELRQFEAVLPAEPTEADLAAAAAVWTDRLLADRRFADHFAERLARATVSSLAVEPFFVYRRRRFVVWLGDQLHENRPYDGIVHAMVAGSGLWTETPETNYLTSKFDDERVDPDRLAARTTRAFLGLRIDCAQCHDHFFADWKQTDFQGLTGFFDGVQLSLTGIVDGPIDADDGREHHTPAVPFGAEWLPEDGPPRERLAAWLTDPRNVHFARAIANRVWRLVYGVGLVEPIDDLEAASPLHDVIEFLAADFRSHGHDLKRLVRLCVGAAAFRRGAGGYAEDARVRFASFPVTRLRAEQTAAAVMQVSSLRPLDGDASTLVKLGVFDQSGKFVEQFGDRADAEMEATAGTLGQRLTLMNSGIVRERLEAGIGAAAGRIAAFAAGDRQRVELLFLTAMSRRPTAAERDHFVAQLAGAADRRAAIEDMLWSLVNATEFSWNR